MIKQTPGRIFLAAQREVHETAQCRRFSTLGADVAAMLGGLRAVHEEALAGGQQVALPVAEATHVLVLPITGAVEVGDPAGEMVAVEVAEAYVLTLPAGRTLHLRNPYPAHPITLLHVWLAAAPAVAAEAGRRFAFEQAALANCLLPVAPAAGDSASELPFRLSLGQFAGRAEAVYALPPNSQFFAYVLAGAFEVAGRLLHANDGLTLWNTAEVELEALSHNALVLVLELPEG